MAATLFQSNHISVCDATTHIETNEDLKILIDSFQELPERKRCAEIEDKLKELYKENSNNYDISITGGY